MDRSHEDPDLLEKVAEALQHAENPLSDFKEAVADKHAIVFLGNTRSGKSTLVNYVIGTPLIAYEERAPIYKIKKSDKNSLGPKIGQGSRSCTTIPGIYQLNNPNLIIVDMPGFDDNRGDVQDIINALYILQLKFAKTVKFVLVCDMNDIIIDNVKGFTDLIEKVYVLFPNFEEMKDSVSIVFTKDHRSYTQGEIADLIKRKILDVNELQTHKQLIEHFVQKQEVIGLFRMPQNNGEVRAEVDVSINNARMATSASSMNCMTMKVALSSKSRLTLLKVYQQYLDSSYFHQVLVCILRPFNNHFQMHDYVFASTEGELKDDLQNLNRVLLLLQSEAKKIISSIADIKESVDRIFPYNRSLPFDRTLLALVAIDSNFLMEVVYRDKFTSKYAASLDEIINKAKNLLDKVKTELHDRDEKRKMFNASVGVAGAGASVAVAGGMYNVLRQGTRLASGFGWLGIAATAVSSLAATIAATSHIMDDKVTNRRIEARKRQNRAIYDDMFKLDH